MHCQDFTGLLERYDKIDMLDFELADLLPANQAAGQFPFEKSTGVDRLMARAKRERVVQDEVEKANRRPTDPARPPSLLL